MRFALLIGPVLAWTGAAMVAYGGGTGWWPWWAAVAVAALCTLLAFVAWRAS